MYLSRIKYAGKKRQAFEEPLHSRIFAGAFAAAVPKHKKNMPSLRQLFLAHVAQTSAFPLALEIERAEGMYLYDSSGKAYLDLIAGIGVSSLGHRHPNVIKAIHEQTQRYLHTMVYGEFVLAPQVQLAELLSAHLPDPLDSVYFVNSGTEAVAKAIRHKIV